MGVPFGRVALAVAGFSATLIACTSEERAMPRSSEERVEAEAPLAFYVGTYTGGESRGVYRFTLDPVSGDHGPIAVWNRDALKDQITEEPSAPTS